MIRAKEIPDDERARVVYLTASAVSTALRARGGVDPRLYVSRTTELALWAGLIRGNLLALMRLLVDIIRISDAERGCRTPLGKVRYQAARFCLAASIDCCALIPAGPEQGTPPLEV